MMGQAWPKAALAAVMLSGACADSLERIGEPPVMTAPGAPRTEVAPLAHSRAALARKAPPPPPESYEAASLWRSGPASLFGDRRARTVGDIMTVVIEIDESAQMSNQSERQRSGSEDMGVSAMLGLTGIVNRMLPEGGTTDPAVGLESGSTARGSGGISREEEVTLRLAATVTDMLPNGHLVIYGSQELRVNNELRDLQVAGIVRPEDITRRNEIGYDKIADARIVYGGRGMITNVQQPRYGQQVLDAILPF
jgi:flagellar L-ring protein precursor FlgH